MTRFLDGPAAGVSLLLTRAPLFLRVTQDADGAWDALGLLDDSPAARDTVYVYRRKGRPGGVHIDATVKGRRVGRWYSMADYRQLEPQPASDTTRDTAKWREWATARAAEEVKPS